MNTKNPVEKFPTKLRAIRGGILFSMVTYYIAAIDQVGEAVQNRGIWVIDRGGDHTVHKTDLRPGERQSLEVCPFAKHDGTSIGCILFCSCGTGSEPETYDNDRTYIEKRQKGLRNT